LNRQVLNINKVIVFHVHFKIKELWKASFKIIQSLNFSSSEMLKL
jgi:hypothetical protein